MDSTAVLAAANLGLQAQLELAKQTIAAQQSMATYSVTVLAIVVAALAGATWLWNFVLNKRLIASQVSRAKDEIRAASIETVKGEVKAASDKLKVDFEQQTLYLDAERARLFAGLNWQIGSPQQACLHAVSAIKLYAKAKDDNGMRLIVNGLRTVLGDCTWLQSETKTEIRECLQFIPVLLLDAREAIEKTLNALPDTEPPKAPPPHA